MPDVAQTISDFYRVAIERDLARDFQFRVLSIDGGRSEEHTSELQSQAYLECRRLLEKKKDFLSISQPMSRTVSSLLPSTKRKSGFVFRTSTPNSPGTT